MALFEQWFKGPKAEHAPVGVFCVVVAACYVLAVACLVGYLLTKLPW
jgi:hypothetical protein